MDDTATNVNTKVYEKCNEQFLVIICRPNGELGKGQIVYCSLSL